MRSLLPVLAALVSSAAMASSTSLCLRQFLKEAGVPPWTDGPALQSSSHDGRVTILQGTEQRATSPGLTCAVKHSAVVCGTDVVATNEGLQVPHSYLVSPSGKSLLSATAQKGEQGVELVLLLQELDPLTRGREETGVFKERFSTDLPTAGVKSRRSERITAPTRPSGKFASGNGGAPTITLAAADDDSGWIVALLSHASAPSALAFKLDETPDGPPRVIEQNWFADLTAAPPEGGWTTGTKPLDAIRLGGKSYRFLEQGQSPVLRSMTWGTRSLSTRPRRHRPTMDVFGLHSIQTFGDGRIGVLDADTLQFVATYTPAARRRAAALAAFVPGSDELLLWDGPSGGVELWNFQTEQSRRIDGSRGPTYVAIPMEKATCHVLVGRPGGPRWHLAGLSDGRVLVQDLVNAKTVGAVALVEGAGPIADIAYLSQTGEVLVVDTASRVYRLKLEELVHRAQ